MQTLTKKKAKAKGRGGAQQGCTRMDIIGHGCAVSFRN
jgi:hypothetical protein